jgi:hypothetical protein
MPWSIIVMMTGFAYASISAKSGCCCSCYCCCAVLQVWAISISLHLSLCIQWSNPMGLHQQQQQRCHRHTSLRCTYSSCTYASVCFRCCWPDPVRCADRCAGHVSIAHWRLGHVCTQGDKHHTVSVRHSGRGFRTPWGLSLKHHGGTCSLQLQHDV